MPHSIPWSVAQEVAEAQDCRQVIICAWDGQRTHVLTYGKSVDDSDQAAQGGNFVKKALGWEERLCLDQSPGVVRLRTVLIELIDKVEQLESCRKIPSLMQVAHEARRALDGVSESDDAGGVNRA